MKLLIGLIIGLGVGGAGAAFFLLKAASPQGPLVMNCHAAIMIDGDDTSAWDARFGAGKGEKARELCKLIVE